jgi:hypothetical protein
LNKLLDATAFNGEIVGETAAGKVVGTSRLFIGFDQEGTAGGFEMGETDLG